MVRCFGCGSPNHKIKECDKLDKQQKIYLVQEVSLQLEGSCINLNFLSDEAISNEDASISSSDVQQSCFVEVNQSGADDVDCSKDLQTLHCKVSVFSNSILNPAERLRERNDLHASMGEAEVMYSSKKSNFRGICVDHGAETSIANLKQYLAYLTRVSMSPCNLKSINKNFKFGDSREVPI